LITAAPQEAHFRGEAADMTEWERGAGGGRREGEEGVKVLRETFDEGCRCVLRFSFRWFTS